MTALRKTSVDQGPIQIRLLWKERVVGVSHNEDFSEIDLPLRQGKFPLYGIALKEGEVKKYDLRGDLKLMITREAKPSEIEKEKSSAAEIIFVIIVLLFMCIGTIYWARGPKQFATPVANKTEELRRATFVYDLNETSVPPKSETDDKLLELPENIRQRKLTKNNGSSSKQNYASIFASAINKNINQQNQNIIAFAKNGRGQSSFSISQPQAVGEIGFAAGNSTDPYKNWTGKPGPGGKTFAALGGKPGSTINFGTDLPAVAGGSIDRDGIRKVILANSSQVKSCYDRGLSTDPSMHGKIVLQWQIDDRGSVSAAQVKASTLENSKVESCVLAALRSWRFPPTPQGQTAEVTYPMIFLSQTN